MAHRARTTLNRIVRFAKRSWRGIALGILKWLATFIVAIFALDLMVSSNSSATDRALAVFFIAAFALSLVYWIFVSLRVRLHLPGIDPRELETGNDGSNARAECAGHANGSDEHANHGDVSGSKSSWPTFLQRKKQQDAPPTIQITRLSSKTTQVHVANDAPLPVLRAEMAISIEREPENVPESSMPTAELVMGSPFTIPARSIQPAAVANVFDHVGIYRLRSAGVRVYGLFGLLSHVQKPAGEWRVRVVPNIYRLTRGIPADRKMAQDDLGIPDAPSDAIDYDRVRDYRPGDPLKTIHWKLVAHGQGDLYTKLFETATASSVTLLIDPYGQQSHWRDADYRMHDTMLEGAFSLLEHARENGLAGRLRFESRSGSLLDAEWEGPAMLGLFVESARRPSHTPEASAQSMQAIRTLRSARTGYAIFATSELTETSVKELIACHHAGVPLLVVHALPERSQLEGDSQRALDKRLRRESIDVIALMDGPQIVREVERQ